MSGLAEIPDGSIDCMMSSPPYWGLRDYAIPASVWDGKKDCKHRWKPVVNAPPRERRNADQKKAGGAAVGSSQKSREHSGHHYGSLCKNCNAWKGCLGLEPTLDLFLRHLLQVFDEIHRVLKPTGTCWVNLGDSYAGGWGIRKVSAIPTESESFTKISRKSLHAIPHRFVVAMLDRGWILRNHIVWRKPNSLPASVKDRLANTWDHVLFFVKQPSYWFDLDLIRVPHKSGKYEAERASGRRRARDVWRDLVPDGSTAFHPNGKNPGDYWEFAEHDHLNNGRAAVNRPNAGGGNEDASTSKARETCKIAAQNANTTHGYERVPNDVWSISTRRSAFKHFATYPEKLVEIPVLAGCPPLVCKNCGNPKRDVRRRRPNPYAFAMNYRDAKAGKKIPGKRAIPKAELARYDDAKYSSKGGTLVISPGCQCGAGFEPGIVLDPFIGSGTTAVVAQTHGRDYIGLEISAEYATKAARRIRTARAKHPL